MSMTPLKSAEYGGAHAGDGHHPEMPFWRKYILATDHKVIGYQYLFTSLVFLLFGFGLVMLMRWSMAYPNEPIPVIGKLLTAVLGENAVPGGKVEPTFYNQLGAMHGTIMVFLAIVPLAFGAFSNFLIPLQIGAPDMAFPKLNAASYWCYFVGGVIMLASFFIPGGTAQAGWTSYSPLATVVKTHGQTFWLIGMVFLITSSLLAAVNFITTIIQCRAPGMTWSRLPFFCWGQMVTSFLLLLGFPPLEAAAVMQLMDKLAGTSFFIPDGLVVSGQLLSAAPFGETLTVSGGGSVLLWQHLFWFLGHPEVYVLILPALGIVTEIVASGSRKPIMGLKAMVYSVFAVGFLSFIVWAHHMYMTGMGTVISAFFQTTTIIISIPSMVILTMLFLTLWGGSIRFTTPMLFALGFLPMFGIGGLTGIPLAFNAPDLYLHDTYYVIGHFHYVVAPGTILGLMAGIYYWYPKATGRFMNDFWGKVHFWGTLIPLNIVFAPMFIQGMAGVSRRWYDGGQTYQFAQGVLHWNEVMTWGAAILALFQIPFIINFFWSIKKGKPASDNPWEATTMEWSVPNRPPHGNFVDAHHEFTPPEVFHAPYEYSVPGLKEDFLPQNKRPSGAAPGPAPAVKH